MRVRILGSAAGGGLPQWNCACPNCRAVRAGSPDVEARTQSSVAVSGRDGQWFLLNVSPDIRQQIINTPELMPSQEGGRATAIGGCVLTDAEIDHTTGMLLLREGCVFGIYSTPLVHRWLSGYFPIATVLSHFAPRPWTELEFGAAVELAQPSGPSSGLKIRALALEPDVPRYVEEKPDDLAGSVIALAIEDTKTGGKLVYAPGVASVNEALEEAARQADLLLIDGTFWNDEEPIEFKITDRTAREMGHFPVDGAEGSLSWLATLPARHRVYVHINNTNPMLNRSSAQYRKVTEAGVRVGVDGDLFEL